MSQGASFSYDEDNYFIVAPGNIITGEHLKSLTCLLNSDLLYFSLRKFYMGGGIEGELKTNRLLIFPVKKLSESEEMYINNLYDQLKSNESKVIELINEYVYKLYNINDDEIIHINSILKKD